MATIRKQPKAKKTVQKSSANQAQSILLDRLRIGILIVVGAVAIFLLLALFTYNSNDPAWSTAGSNSVIQNAGGAIGAYVADMTLSFFGFFGFVIPLLLVYGLWIIFIENSNFAERSIFLTILRCLGVAINFVAGSGLCQIMLADMHYPLPQGPGGIIGSFVAGDMVGYLNIPGTLLVLFALFCLGLTLYSGGAWFKFIVQAVLFFLKKMRQLFSVIGKSWQESRKKARAQAVIHKKVKEAKKKQAIKDEAIMEKALKAETVKDDEHYHIDDKPNSFQNDIPPFDMPVEPAIGFDHSNSEVSDTMDYDASFLPSNFNQAPMNVKEDQIPFADFDAVPLSGKAIEEPISTKGITKRPKKHKAVDGLPSLNLLDDPDAKAEAVSKAVLDRMAALVEEKLADFGVKTSVVAVHPGPVITRFELELAPGVKVSKLTALSQDLARSLSTSRVRVVEVIPGKPYVGIELPNQNREMVRIKEILSHPAFVNSVSPLTIALGKDIAGNPEVANIGKMPHLLVAGTTGSGKSVGVNAMIISMLYKAGPDDLRMIMIDPKMLELSIYEGIPHLLTPVVTDMKEAASALRWCVKEMDERYELMAAVGVRNIAGLNDKIKTAKESGAPMKDPLWMKLHPGRVDEAPELYKMPYIVVISDEFADMIMVVGKKVEELIARIAQKARAAGIHLILATQRPSVDVVTGLIKANIPTRIAFQVSSRIDSRTIIDQQGAEQLLGHGDMLYLPPGTGMPIRVHGAFVDDDEVHRVVSAWKEMGGEPDYIDSILTTESVDGDGTAEDGGGEKDALYDEAVKIVLESQRASISSVQRRLRIGYNRAARLIEDMERAGVVSEMQSNGMREVLVRRTQ